MRLETNHSVTRKNDIFADVVTANEKTVLLQNLEQLNLRSRLKNSSQFKALYRSLTKFGLSKNEAKIYLYLTKLGIQKAYKISKSLSIHRSETYKTLRRLEEKGLVYRILERPLKFAATPIRKGLDTMIHVEKRRANQLKEEKERILNSWRFISIPINDARDESEFIRVLKGRNQIYAKTGKIIEEAKNEVLIASSDEDLLHMFYSGALDDLAEKASKIKVQLMTNSSFRSSYIVKKMRLEEDKYSFTDFKHPSFIISDRHLLLFRSDGKTNGKNSQHAIWTNQKDIIKAMKTSFSTLNGGSIDSPPEARMLTGDPRAQQFA